MHLAVTVEAVPAQHILVWLGRRQAGSAVQRAGMKCGRVALLAQERAPRDQQIVVDCTMGGVTKAAILGCRSVFEELGAAVFRVTLVAGVVESWFHQGELRAGTVAVVAVAAQGPALLDRMARWQIGLSALARMAVVAGFRLGALVQYRIGAGVQLVAAATGDVLIVVHAAGPEHLLPAAVAIGTTGDLILRRRGLVGTVTYRRCNLQWLFCVLVALPVTTDASAVATSGNATMAGLQDCVNRLVGILRVTAQAVSCVRGSTAERQSREQESGDTRRYSQQLPHRVAGAHA